MKKHILIAVSLLLSLNVNAQMTLQHVYNTTDETKVVNLLLSGKKYFITDFTGGQVRLYNLNHSLWKTINFPTVAGYIPSFGNIPTYVSENLFIINNKVALSQAYYSSSTSTYKNVIFDETGAIILTVDTLTVLTVHNTGIDTFIACFSSQFVGSNYSKVYSLPGTIPCSKCSSELGLASISNDDNGNLSDPAPNPSSNQTRLTYTLPEGAKQGEISIYSANGKLLKTYKVDRAFTYITIDNSMLPAGIYYYNLVADGNITETKKMLVMK